ncbi:MAG: diacylglycerol kinase [Cellvibrionales bacterium]|nr:diacylglycerol kinase [Cellvibrionales bacterium]|tara:strand:+ start:4302 stop:4727 length:426 start_codon:yes stop_codon:yes gene_type:complete
MPNDAPKKTPATEEPPTHYIKDKTILGLLKRRLIRATKNSISGLRYAFKKEEAFRVQSFLMLLALPAAWWIADTLNEILLLLFSAVLVLIAELLNSAIEATIDRVGMDYHKLSKQAKDMGSAAVFVAIVLAAITWLLILVD